MMSHHGDDPEAARKLADKICAEFQLGPTGQYPRGRVHQTDDGEIKLAVGSKDKLVIVAFGTAVTWLGLPKEQALAFATSIKEHAEALPD